MHIPVFEIVSGANAEFPRRKRHAVSAQRFDIGVERPLILTRMEAEIPQYPARLAVAQSKPVDTEFVLIHMPKINFYLQIVHLFSRAPATLPNIDMPTVASWSLSSLPVSSRSLADRGSSGPNE